MSWATVIASLVAAVLGGGGSVAIVTALARRQVTRVEAASVLNESTLKWASNLMADADEARRDAGEARREATEARREATDARRAAEDAAREARVLKTAIMSPYASLEGLRAMISDSPGNGVARVPGPIH